MQVDTSLHNSRFDYDIFLILLNAACYLCTNATYFRLNSVTSVHLCCPTVETWKIGNDPFLGVNV